MKNKFNVTLMIAVMFSVLVLGNIDSFARSKYTFDENHQTKVEKFETSSQSSAKPAPAPRYAWGVETLKDWWRILLPFLPYPSNTAPVQ